ncbi:MAG: hypothetical protein IT320_28240 [Anaerolineae bacterium]|nr:hypothetical protein [Anaerolineae bacterium]
MATTSKLIVYNEALRELGSAQLANLVTVNTSLTTLNGAFDHAVEYILSRLDWNFARRRASLSGVSDTSYPPYTYRFTRPSDYLRKCWVKTSAADAHQIDHAEAGAVIYGFVSSALIEYVSDHADNYDPANWPPHFTRCLALYLASLVGPKLARSDDATNGVWAKLQQALSEAEAFENVFLTNALIPTERHPVFRRAIEIMGQSLAGSVAIHSQADKLRWSMSQAWDYTVKYCLEQGAWNFATRRALMTGGSAAVPGDTYEGIVEGYAVSPASESEGSDLPDMDGWDYGHYLPDDFLHKIWIKADANNREECPHQFMRDAVYVNYENVVLEYVSDDDDAIDPDNWPATFLELVAARLALTVAPEMTIEETGKGRAKVSSTGVRQSLDAFYTRALSDARMKDAAQQYPVSLPPGQWARARMGSTYSTMRSR